MLLEIHDLAVHYGGVAAVKGISLNVEEGSIVTLIGANGAGKSTVLRSICGLKEPTSGGIRFAGHRIDGLPTHRVIKMGISMVPEGRRLFPKMTVEENLRMGAYIAKDRQEKAETLNMVCDHFPILKRRMSQQSGTLSGGEQQMLAMGRALMSRPRLLLLDEPSLGLSPILTIEIGKIITEIGAHWEATILLVEQNARLALSLGHKGYVMETGHIVLEGKTEDLLKDEGVKKAYLGI